MNEKIMAIIPARGGSKRIHRKNIKMIAGKPLIAWTIEAAKESKLIDNFFVSTEDKEIKKISEILGVNVLDRPKELAEDNTASIDVLKYVLKQKPADIIVMLQCTSPIRDRGLIDKCIKKFIDSDSDCLATGKYETEGEWGTYNTNSDNYNGNKNKGFFHDDGNVYIFKRSLIESGNLFSDNNIKFEITREENIDINDDFDFWLAERIIEKNYKKEIDFSKIKLIVSDFDGVMTNNTVIVDENGKESVICNRGDGRGIELIKEKGIDIIVISKEKNKIVETRCKKLKVKVIHGADNKIKFFKEEVEKRSLNMDEVCYIGNDINDLECIKEAGIGVVVADAHGSIFKFADYVTKNKGGEGAIREVCDIILDNY